ncbi:hypothetical protein M404DRAFT_30138 [Pisolithus tinctorius Marx 270]|uniref:Uncharacterized protein n=1 Tax=Pisolithus tinctorius Marx 270 TaxID=870435 RepID=A0A0C3IRY7_PISTI|nr:hypothetical protein M404DRAFT_30138 [Pisolithus tinctorius Marx 270]
MLDWIGEASTFHSCFPIRITSYQPLPLAPVPQTGTEEQSLTASQPPASSKALRKLYRSLIKSPLPRFVNRRLTLSCFSYRVTSVELQRANPSSSSSYTYAIQAFGLKPLEIMVPAKLDNATMENVAGSLQLVRPWHLKSLGGSTKLDAAAAEQLLVTLGGPFNALLLTELPHNEYKRIAPSTLIVAQPVDSASILQSKIRILNLV